jgi:tetraacyldisaccharide-1-P 4'-kinase
MSGLDPKKHSYDTDIKQQPEKQKLYHEAERRAYQTFTYVDSISVSGINNIKHFFEALKQYQPLKYRKAVSEFIKAVGL